MALRSGPRAPGAAVPSVLDLAGQLADDLDAALPLALSRLVSDLRLTSLVLRGDGDLPEDRGVLAVAGDVVHAVPAPRGHSRPVADGVVHLPLEVGGRRLAVLTATGAGPLVLAELRDAADLLALALAAGRRPAGTDVAPADLLDAAEAGLATVADALHDGPVQALVAARWLADVAVRDGDAALARDALHDALVTLRRALWQLRPRGAGGLVEALSGLSSRLVELGRPPLELHVDPVVADRLSPQERALAYRLVQACALPAAGGDPVLVRLVGVPPVLALTGGVLPPVVDTLAIWAGALGASVQVDPTAPVGVRLLLGPRTGARCATSRGLAVAAPLAAVPPRATPHLPPAPAVPVPLGRRPEPVRPGPEPKAAR